MFELVVIDTETGDEAELLCQGTFDQMTEAMEDSIQDNEDTGGDWQAMRIQPVK
jgi:hypothetical protein